MDVVSGFVRMTSEHSSQHGYALDELIKELAECRKNPLLQLKPCWKYVRENDINQQLRHVMSECDEVERAMTLEEIASEFWDILQGAVTGIFILKIKYS